MDNLSIETLEQLPASSKKNLLIRLETCGYSLCYIFPDFEHIAEQIKNEFIK
jgi:hypothetical protein